MPASPRYSGCIPAPGTQAVCCIPPSHRYSGCIPPTPLYSCIPTQPPCTQVVLQPSLLYSGNQVAFPASPRYPGGIPGCGLSQLRSKGSSRLGQLLLNVTLMYSNQPGLCLTQLNKLTYVNLYLSFTSPGTAHLRLLTRSRGDLAGSHVTQSVIPSHLYW